MFLEQFVLYKIESELSTQKNLEKMKVIKADEIREKINVLIKDKEVLARRKAVLQRKRFEDYEKAVFNKEFHFQTDVTMSHVEEKIIKIDAEIDRLEKEIPRKSEIASFFNGRYRTEITAELVETFIQKIIVYDEEHIEIEWKYETEKMQLFNMI